MLQRACLVILSLLAASMLPRGASAVDCHTINSGDLTPAGFGVPWNPLAGAGNELLIAAQSCSGSSANIVVGNGSSNQYVYRFGYSWNGSQWVQFSLAGTELIDGSWYRGEATAALTGTAGQDNNIVAYVCSWTGSAWKCGCKDAACTTPLWQLQRFHPEALVADVVRNTMHRNLARQTEYTPLNNALTPATVTFVEIDSWPIDGTATVNDRSGLYPIDVDGDDNWEFVHFDGSSTIRIYNQAGTKLWQRTSATGVTHRDNVHMYNFGIDDFDGDGGQDIAHCWDGNQSVVIRDGSTGNVIFTTPIPGLSDDDCHVQSFRMETGTSPIILVALPTQPGFTCACCGNRPTTWAATRAYNGTLNQLWETDTCAAGHMTHQVDEDGDNLAEAIFVGKYKLSSTGQKLCTIALGADHADGNQIGDIIPSNPGHEVAIAAEVVGGGVYDTSNCALIWESPLANPQSVVIGEIDTGQTGLEVALQQRPSEPNRTINIHSSSGTLLTTFSGLTAGFGSLVMQSHNIDDRGPEEIMGWNGSAFNRNGLVLNTPAWSNPDAFEPIIMDIIGDSRPEIIYKTTTEIIIGGAQ